MIALMTAIIVNASENNVSSPEVSKLIDVPANDIVASVDGNSIVYDHINLVGDLDLNNLNYKSIKITNSIIEGNITATNTTVNGDAIFTNTSFKKDATFFNSEIDGNADFSFSRFYGNANFSQSRFPQGAIFDFNSFEKDADFSASEFQKSGSFYCSIFKGNASFVESHFDGTYTEFELAQFLGKTDFGGAQFKTLVGYSGANFSKDSDFHAAQFDDEAAFMDTTFRGSTDFSRCRFIGESLFQNTHFNKTADFSSSEFNGPSFFNKTQFYRDAIFNDVQFLGPSDFSDARFDKNLSMNRTQINTMRFDNVTFNKSSHLFLAKADIQRFMVDWNLIKNILSYDNSAYLSLVKNYRDLGLDEADDCYYQYRFLNQESKSWGWSKVYDIMAEITCGYGVRPDRPITCSIVLVVFCALIFFLGRGLKGHENTDKRELFFDSLYYSIATFLEVHTEIKPRGRHRYVSVLLKSLQWLLFALLVGTITKVMIG